ncbi:MAG: ferrous iron transport protein A [Propionibacteriaceae bacterium]|nr:ferrous iron transport protein A [Propionibacteriaceae bacterium]
MVSGVMSLGNAPLHTPLTLVTCLIEPGLRSRLATLGLRTGSPLEVVLTTAGHGRVIGVAGSRIAMDVSVLRQLHVKLASGGE